jgi:hypothetical protein
MAYNTLGARGPVQGAKDNSGHNSGNWTIAFTPDILTVNVPQFEVYKMVVTGADNTTFNVFVDAWLWDLGVYGTMNAWDPNEPLIMRPGQTLYFCYSDAVTDNHPPSATIWLRYDASLYGIGQTLCPGKP